MTKYEYLLELRTSGELKILMRNFELPTHYLAWMDIFAYHLDHPKLSQFQVATQLSISKAKVWDAYQFMNQELAT